jgi:hypothetical protein
MNSSVAGLREWKTAAARSLGVTGWGLLEPSGVARGDCELHSQVCHFAIQGASLGEQLEMGDGLIHGQHLVEGVKVDKASFSARPGERLGHLHSRPTTGGNRLQAELEPLFVVAEELLDPVLQVAEGGAVGGQNQLSGEVADQLQGAQEREQGQPAAGDFDPD